VWQAMLFGEHRLPVMSSVVKEVWTPPPGHRDVVVRSVLMTVARSCPWGRAWSRPPIVHGVPTPLSGPGS
jgi:hypothetical protein